MVSNALLSKVHYRWIKGSSFQLLANVFQIWFTVWHLAGYEEFAKEGEGELKPISFWDVQ